VRAPALVFVHHPGDHESLVPLRRAVQQHRSFNQHKQGQVEAHVRAGGSISMVPVPKLPLIRIPGAASAPAPGAGAGAAAVCPSFVAGVCHKLAPVHQEPAPIPGLTPVAPQREPLGAAENTCWHHHPSPIPHPHSHSQPFAYHPHSHPHSHHLSFLTLNVTSNSTSRASRSNGTPAPAVAPWHTGEGRGTLRPVPLAPPQPWFRTCSPPGASREGAHGIEEGAGAGDHVVCIRPQLPPATAAAGVCHPHTGVHLSLPAEAWAPEGRRGCGAYRQGPSVSGPTGAGQERRGGGQGERRESLDQ